MTAYSKTLTSKGFISDLYDYIVEVGAELLAPYFINETFAKAIDNYYYFAWSGDKSISVTLEKLWDKDEEEIPATHRRALAEMFWDLNRFNLNRLWNDFQADYNAVEPYHVWEKTDYEHSGESGYTDSGDDFRKKYGKIESYGKTREENFVKGFDEETAPVFSDKVDTTVGADNQKMTTDYGNGEANALTEKISHGKSRDASESANDDLDIEKYGNLGIMPIADLIKKDIELWQWNFYKNVLFKAIDSLLTLPIYQSN